ncbi:MAG: winged helix-turn-helix domain-containing protein [Rhodanobacteraceae bacterium]
MTIHTGSVIQHRPPEEPRTEPNIRLQIGDQIVDVGTHRVVSHPEHTRLTSKATAVLLDLAEHAGNTVPREELLNHVWNGRCPTPDVLTQAIKELRRALGDDSRLPRYIETIPKVGYRLCVPVTVLANGGFEEDRVSTPAEEGRNLAARERPGEAGAALRRPRGLAFSIPFALIVAAALVAMGWWMIARIEPSTGTDSPGWRVAEKRVLTADPGPEWRARVSPDGTRITYLRENPGTKLSKIWMRGVDSSRPIRLTSEQRLDEEMPTWSPDGAQIAFERFNETSCQVYTTPALGGAERRIGACQSVLTNYFDWAPGGRALITSTLGMNDKRYSLRLVRWDIDSGQKIPLKYARSREDQDLEAHYSPDGTQIAFRRGLAPVSDLYVMSAQGGKPRRITHLAARIHGYTWTADGSAIVFSSDHEGAGALYVVGLSDQQVQPLGITSAEYPDMARNGDIVTYVIARVSSRLLEFSLQDHSKKPVPIAASTGKDDTPAISPDGRKLAFLSDRGGSSQVWLYDFNDSTSLRLTEFADAKLINPVWDASGERVLVTRKAGAVGSLIEIDPATRRVRAVSSKDDRILYGDRGPRPGEYLLVVDTGSSRTALYLLKRNAAGDVQRTHLADNVSRARYDPASHDVYYTKTSEAGLFRRSIAGTGEQQITNRIYGFVNDGWQILDGKIWYIPSMTNAPTVLHRLDPATGIDEVVAQIDAAVSDVHFAVSPDRQQVVLAASGPEDTDIGAFRLIVARR